MVPREYWVPSKGYGLEEWSEAVGDDFRFYLECPAFENDEEAQRFQDQCTEMGDLLGGIVITDDICPDALDIHCRVFRPPSFRTKDLCVAVLDKEFDDLRKIRAWLEDFDKDCDADQKVVFVTDGNNDDIQMEALMRVRTLSEMMGL